MTQWHTMLAAEQYNINWNIQVEVTIKQKFKRSYCKSDIQIQIRV